MFKKLSLLSSILLLSVMVSTADACREHYYFSQGNTGLFGGSNAMSQINRPAFKPKVFKVKHPVAAVTEVDKDTKLKINYDVPSESKNVKLQLTATNNVELMQDDIELNDQNGPVTASYRVSQNGVDTITVTVSGEHNGENLSYTSKIYINTKSS